MAWQDDVSRAAPEMRIRVRIKSISSSTTEGNKKDRDGPVAGDDSDGRIRRHR